MFDRFFNRELVDKHVALLTELVGAIEAWSKKEGRRPSPAFTCSPVSQPHLDRKVSSNSCDGRVPATSTFRKDRLIPMEGRSFRKNLWRLEIAPAFTTEPNKTRPALIAESSTTTATEDQVRLLHRKLEHASVIAMRRRSQDGVVLEIVEGDLAKLTNKPCIAHLDGKQHRAPLSTSKSRCSTDERDRRDASCV
jgi:hypothetical protein